MEVFRFAMNAWRSNGDNSTLWMNERVKKQEMDSKKNERKTRGTCTISALWNNDRIDCSCRPRQYSYRWNFSKAFFQSRLNLSKIKKEKKSGEKELNVTCSGTRMLCFSHFSYSHRKSSFFLQLGFGCDPYIRPYNLRCVCVCVCNASIGAGTYAIEVQNVVRGWKRNVKILCRPSATRTKRKMIPFQINGFFCFTSNKRNKTKRNGMKWNWVLDVLMPTQTCH